MQFRFSATTVMLPSLDLDMTISMLSELGYRGVEWRVRRTPEDKKDKPWGFWGNHRNDLPPEKFLKEAGRIRKKCDDHGLQIVALAPRVRADETEELKMLADGAAESALCGPTGTAAPMIPPMLRVGTPRNYDGSTNYNELYQEAVEAFGKAIEITKQRRVRILLEIHGNTIAVSSSLAHRLVSNFSARDIGVIYDPHNMVMDGYETPQLALELLGPYLAHVHMGAFKPLTKEADEAGTVSWKWERCPLKEGLYNYKKMFQALEKVGYRGFCSLEDFRPGQPMDLLNEAMDWFKKIGVA